MDIVCHWRGSTHDSRIFRECTLKDRFDRGDFRGRLLGDGGYACTNCLFTPVQNPITSAEMNYNIAHIATRNTIERTFGLWKSRFRILQTGMRCSLKNVNLAIQFNDDLEPNDENDSLSNIDSSFQTDQHPTGGQESSRAAFITAHFT